MCVGCSVSAKCTNPQAALARSQLAAKGTVKHPGVCTLTVTILLRPCAQAPCSSAGLYTTHHRIQNS
jgi:hypothetical protein